jgi:hypothetical protein
MGAILALLLVLARATPVHAHPLATQQVVGVGQPITLNIGIPAEGNSPMVGVDITIPGGFDLTEAVPVAGWTVEREKGAVRYRGGPLPVGQFVLFSLKGQIPKKSTLRFPMVLRAADGTSRRWDDKKPSDPYPAAIVYAGTSPKGAGGGSSPLGTLSKAAVLGGAIGLALSLLLRLRRRGEE